MIRFEGIYFDGIHSKAEPVSLLFDGVTLYIESSGISPRLAIPINDCTITSPLGRTRRTIGLPAGSLIETDNEAAINELERLTGKNRGMRAVHLLESHWKAVLVCVIALALCVWGFTRFGIPLMASHIADKVPPPSMERMSRDALRILDTRFLGPSGLTQDKTKKVTIIFESVKKDLGAGSNYRLEIRKGRIVGANAFALPSGLIVVTDELAHQAGSEQELAGVLAHEMAHVSHRHAVRQILQSAGVFFIISAMVGDIASFSSTAASLPMLLVQAGYSRDFEKEADREAGLYCIHKGWGTGPYRKMLSRLSKDHGKGSNIPFISTHPVLSERIKYLEELEKSTLSGRAAK